MGSTLYRMKSSGKSFELLLAGAAFRLFCASVIITILWAGFFWATSTPGAL